MNKKYTWRNYRAYWKDNPKGLWFKRKLYGWGWVPVKWQGWLVILGFIGILLFNGFYLDSKISPTISSTTEPTTFDLGLFFGILLISLIILFWICYKKGEKPKWSWGR